MSESTQKQDSNNEQNRDDAERTLFKTAMRDVRIAKDFLSQHLPDDVKKVVNLDSLKLEGDVLKNKDMPDVLYSVNFKSVGTNKKN